MLDELRMLKLKYENDLILAQARVEVVNEILAKFESTETSAETEFTEAETSETTSSTTFY